MPRTSKIPPLQAFHDSIDDAMALVEYASAFRNKRSRGMRTEMKSRIGEALRLNSRQRDGLDCIESDSLFVIFLDSRKLGRARFRDPRPLLRQAIVAACAALESYVADKAIERLGSALKSDPQPKRIREISLTVGQWIDIEARYSRRLWGVRKIVEDVIRQQASTAPSRIGEVLGMIGINGWARKIDGLRKVRGGTTVTQLDQLTTRRNRIAHAADRLGSGRASINIKDADAYIDQVQSIVVAMESLLKQT